MADIGSSAPGTPNWVVVATPDAPGTGAFYEGLFGWDVNNQNGGFSTLELGGDTVAGLLALPDDAKAAGATARWLVYLAADDVTKLLDKVQPAGGTILAPAFDVPGAGRMAMVADATGAEFGLWEPWGHDGAEVTGVPGSLTWAELYTRSKAAAANFYTTVFNWEVEEVTAGKDSFITCSIDGTPVAGMMVMSAAWGATPSHWLPYFAVADCDASAALAKTHGAEIAGEPHDTGAGRMAVIRDPQGALFFIVAEAAAGT